MLSMMQSQEIVYGSGCKLSPQQERLQTNSASFLPKENLNVLSAKSTFEKNKIFPYGFIFCYIKRVRLNSDFWKTRHSMFIILTYALKSSGENTSCQNKCPVPEEASLLKREKNRRGTSSCTSERANRENQKHHTQTECWEILKCIFH